MALGPRRVLCWVQTGSPYLQAAVQHGVRTAVAVQGLLCLQLDGVFGVEPEEVDQLRGGIDLRLHHRLTLGDRNGTGEEGEEGEGGRRERRERGDRKSTRLNSSHL